MAGIVQRAMTTNTGGDDMLLSDKDKEILFQSLHELDTNVKQNEIKEVDAIKS